MENRIYEQPHRREYSHDLELPRYEFIPYKASTSRAVIDKFCFGDSLKSMQQDLGVAQLLPGHARGEDSHIIMTDQQGEGGVHTLTGSESNIVQHLELMGEQVPKVKIVESVMVVRSLPGEESPHHGGLTPSVLGKATLPEKGWESNLVLDGRSTGDLDGGARTPIGRAKYHDKSPVMVCGVIEQFRDVKSMVGEWEDIENDVKEWLPVEGRRRGGRRLSRRISELLRSFQEEQGDVMDRQSDEDLDNFNAKFNSFKTLKSNSEANSTVRRKLKVTKCVRIDAHAREGRDWLQITNVSTNQRAEKRKHAGDGDHQTKKRRPGH